MGGGQLVPPRVGASLISSAHLSRGASRTQGLQGAQSWSPPNATGLVRLGVSAERRTGKKGKPCEAVVLVG